MHIKYKKCREVEQERMEKDIPCNSKHKKAGVTILILDKVVLKMRNVIRHKEGKFSINKLVNLLGRLYNSKCVCP